MSAEGGSLASPADGGLPRFDFGSASATMFRGMLSVHSRSGLPTRGVANATLSIEGFGGFVTSSTAPIATGWSDPRQAGLTPTENQTPFTAHFKERTLECSVDSA